jgi:hypothetical protein
VSAGCRGLASSQAKSKKKVEKRCEVVGDAELVGDAGR